MKAGGGKGKGGGFERHVCGLLSLWVSNGQRKDLYWRSAMSGGRATRSLGKGHKLSRQAGDISAVAPEGHALTDRFYIELKFYADLSLERFFVRQAGLLAGFWLKTCMEAAKHNREPMLIVKQNRLPAMLVVRVGAVEAISTGRPFISHVHLKGGLRCEVYLLDDVLRREFTGG